MKDSNDDNKIKAVKIDAAMSALQSALEDIRKKVSDRRKEGHDTYISELLLAYAQPQIKMFDASRSKNDYAKCILLFKEIDKESKIEELKMVLSED